MLLDTLVREKLPDGTLTLLAPMLDKRRQDRKERAAEHEARRKATERLDGIEERIDKLTIRTLKHPLKRGDVLCRFVAQRERAEGVRGVARYTPSGSSLPASATSSGARSTSAQVYDS